MGIDSSGHDSSDEQESRAHCIISRDRERVTIALRREFLKSIAFCFRCVVSYVIREP